MGGSVVNYSENVVFLWLYFDGFDGVLDNYRFRRRNVVPRKVLFFLPVTHKHDSMEAAPTATLEMVILRIARQVVAPQNPPLALIKFNKAGRDDLKVVKVLFPKMLIQTSHLHLGATNGILGQFGTPRIVKGGNLFFSRIV